VNNAAPIAAQKWDREENEWYVEPAWVGRRLFEEERFDGEVVDPCCGLGNILLGARRAGLSVRGFDIIDRGSAFMVAKRNFLVDSYYCDNIVCNPPFDMVQDFAHEALRVASRKVAMVFPARRLNAAGRWLKNTPLLKVLYLTPRPSMPTGNVYLSLQAEGKEASGGKEDFCILVWLRGYSGEPTAGWLHRDGAEI